MTLWGKQNTDDPLHQTVTKVLWSGKFLATYKQSWISTVAAIHRTMCRGHSYMTEENVPCFDTYLFLLVS